MPHEVMGLGLPGILAAASGLIIFFGSVYVLVALNAGWRFGYWITFATLGGLMVFISAFWLANPVGPRGEDPIWIPIAAQDGPISDARFRAATFQAPASYPNEPWAEASDATSGGGVVGFVRDVFGRRRDFADPLFAEVDGFRSAVSNCLGFDEKKAEETKAEVEEKLPGWERNVLEGKFHKRDRLEHEAEVCQRAFSLLPTAESLPVIGDTAVGVTYDVDDIRFTKERGTLLGQATVVPNTYDPRFTGDASGAAAKAVGKPLQVVAYKDAGSVRYPSVIYLLFWGAFFAFHLWGLWRADRRKLSPVAS